MIGPLQLLIRMLLRQQRPRADTLHHIPLPPVPRHRIVNPGCQHRPVTCRHLRPGRGRRIIKPPRKQGRQRHRITHRQQPFRQIPKPLLLHRQPLAGRRAIIFIPACLRPRLSCQDAAEIPVTRFILYITQHAMPSHPQFRADHRLDPRLPRQPGKLRSRMQISRIRQGHRIQFMPHRQLHDRFR